MSGAQKGIAGALVAVLVIGGAGATYALVSNGSSKSSAAAPTATATPSPTASPTPTATPAPAAPPPVNPLTGTGTVPTGPVIAVKIDDTAPGRPQVGIDKADIVYIEQAEGGLTRDVAVFASQKPIAGYIRSTRASDPELLTQYGPIVLVASGGGGDSLKILDASILHPYIQDRGDKGFYRVQRRQSTYINVVLPLSKVSVPGAGKAKSIGLVWSASGAGLAATPVATSLSTKVGGTPVGFTWNASLKKYMRVINGNIQRAADGAVIATPNVIVQFCAVSPHPGDIDVNGNPSQYTHSVGSGKVSIFRNGHRIDGTWSRPTINSGTTYRDAAGKPISVTPGGAWVVLATNGTPLTSR
ncbi:DUF3048 domain-containing protein [Jatrophihabitans sp. GAS493]|uniref:DUF3048 domain-containing protein n=1 Tax=Jatrophihabitans sp. GAS493 TaxID=1907575 RepID=UPI000BB91A0F|nr:DUF3048 domain-containing protein [Jatrophihabitans sp. GAS493]